MMMSGQQRTLFTDAPPTPTPAAAHALATAPTPTVSALVPPDIFPHVSPDLVFGSDDDEECDEESEVFNGPEETANIEPPAVKRPRLADFSASYSDDGVFEVISSETVKPVTIPFKVVTGKLLNTAMFERPHTLEQLRPLVRLAARIAAQPALTTPILDPRTMRVVTEATILGVEIVFLTEAADQAFFAIDVDYKPCAELAVSGRLRFVQEMAHTWPPVNIAPDIKRRYTNLHTTYGNAALFISRAIWGMLPAGHGLNRLNCGKLVPCDKNRADLFKHVQALQKKLHDTQREIDLLHALWGCPTFYGEKCYCGKAMCTTWHKVLLSEQLPDT